MYAEMYPLLYTNCERRLSEEQLAEDRITNCLVHHCDYHQQKRLLPFTQLQKQCRIQSLTLHAQQKHRYVQSANFHAQSIEIDQHPNFKMQSDKIPLHEPTDRDDIQFLSFHNLLLSQRSELQLPGPLVLVLLNVHYIPLSYCNITFFYSGYKE
ncbi:hypothetical protein CHUAL_002196 [Chamberlinius hualienensis]